MAKKNQSPFYKMKGSPFQRNFNISPIKGFWGKVLNPAQMLPGQLGKFFGRLPGSNL